MSNKVKSIEIVPCEMNFSDMINLKVTVQGRVMHISTDLRTDASLSDTVWALRDLASALEFVDKADE